MTKTVLWIMLLAACWWLAADAEAWRPEGWVWHSWPYQFASQGGAWYYLQESQDLWGLSLTSVTWHRLRDLQTTWMYFAWPYVYALDSGTWYWLNEANVLWGLNMTSWQWSRYGQAGDPPDLYLVVDLSAGPAAAGYPVSFLQAAPPGGWGDEYKTTRMALRRVPAGAFAMGSPDGELGRDPDETPHQVTLTKDFYIGVFEVTQRQWERVAGNWPAYFTNLPHREARPVEEVSYNNIRGPVSAANWPSTANVSADSFMGRLRARTGRAFDLPTEAQWELACRAGTSTALNSGKNLTGTGACPHMAEVGRYWHNGGSAYSANADASAGSAKAGSYPPNAWGLYDMHGNVWEWCLDWYGAYPGDVVDPKGVGAGVSRVVRGGAWFGNAESGRSAERNDFRASPDRSFDLGFRVALTLP